MNVKVRYFTTMRELAGTKEDDLELVDGSGLQDVLEKISSLYGQEALEYLYVNGQELDPSIKFLINGSTAQKGDVVKEGDVIAIIPPIGGG